MKDRLTKSNVGDYFSGTMTITRAAVTEAKSLDKRSRALANLTMTIAGGFTIGAGELLVYTSDAFDRNRITNATFLSIASATFEWLVSAWRLMTTNKWYLSVHVSKQQFC